MTSSEHAGRPGETATIAVDGGGRVISVSATAEELLGYPEDALVGTVLHETLHREADACPLLVALTGGGPAFGDADRFARSDGASLLARWAYVPAGATGGTLAFQAVTSGQAGGVLTASSVAGLDVATLYRPAGSGSQLGGDWVDAFALADGSLGLVIGDVMGHDEQAASRMGVVRHMLRALAADRLAPPSEVLSRLDAVVQQFDILELATLLYARVTPADGGRFRLEWSSAGHPPPLLLPALSQPRLLDGLGDLPLGVGDLPRRDLRQVLEPGSDLVLYTDGLVEHRGESLTDGLRALTRAADGLGHLPVDRLVHALAERATPSRADDLAVLAVRLPHPPVSGRVCAPSRPARTAAPTSSRRAPG